MRKEVKKFLFVGPSEEKRPFFEQLQAIGIVDFINPGLKNGKGLPEEIERNTKAIKIVRSLPVLEQEENEAILDAETIISSIIALHEQDEALKEKIRVLDSERARIHPFGHFSAEDIAYIEKEGRCTLQFFAARPTLFQDEELPEGLIYVASENGLFYYISVNDRPVLYEKMMEMRFPHTLDEIEREKTNATLEHQAVEQKLKQYAKYNDYLHHILIDSLDRYHLKSAESYVQAAMGESLFAVEGWVPVDKEDELLQTIEHLNIYAEEVAIEPEDVVPTYLENEGQARLGEDLVHIYDTPSSTDSDPSLWVLYGFALFFAFIIGDAGYGMVYMALALFLRYKFPDLKGAAKRALNLFTLLCGACIIWGTLMTSFFGMEIGIDNPLRKLSLLQWLAEKKAEYHISHMDAVYQEWIAKFPELGSITDVHQFVSFTPKGKEGSHLILNKLTDNIMFELALFVGVVHLIVSLLRYANRHYQNIGWALFLVGAYLYFPSYLGVPSFLNFVGGIDLAKGGAFGFDLMFVGIGLAWGLSILKNGWTGIFEVMTLIQVFADTLSYLRLYALGLAGAIVGSTINEIASQMPLIFSILLIVSSHFINIILATMSGVIHGLRLNFLEWYHYSFEGGGRQFQPLKLLKKE